MLKVGCDPEYFLKKGDQYVSAHDLVPGDKRDPFPLSGGGAVQADGTAVEFNIKPAIDELEFARNISSALSDIRGMLDPALVFDFKPSIIYPQAYFDTLPNFSKELGCDPDYNAYTGLPNPRPNAHSTTMRTGAGHIHLGWCEGADPLSKSHMWDCCELVKELDHYFKYPQTLWDKDNKRRELYGAPGAFRPKSYGVEYRVLSNAWLNYPKLWPWLFKSVQFVFGHLKVGQYRGIPWCSGSYTSAREVNQYLTESYYRSAPLIPEDWNGPVAAERPKDERVNPPSKHATYAYTADTISLADVKRAKIYYGQGTLHRSR